MVGTRAELEQGRAFWRDKLVALEADKAQFCDALCRVKVTGNQPTARRVTAAKWQVLPAMIRT